MEWREADLPRDGGDLAAELRRLEMELLLDPPHMRVLAVEGVEIGNERHGNGSLQLINQITSLSVLLQVPSAYFLADVFLELDNMLHNMVYMEDPENGRGSREAQACADAVRAKKCCGAVRYLWRNSKSGSHDESIQKIKDLLIESPTQRRNNNAGAEALRDEELDAEPEASEPEASEPEASGSEPEGEGSGSGGGSQPEDPEEVPSSQASTLVMGEVAAEIPPSQESEPENVELPLTERMQAAIAEDIMKELQKDEAVRGLLGLKLYEIIYIYTYIYVIGLIGLREEVSNTVMFSSVFVCRHPALLDYMLHAKHFLKIYGAHVVPTLASVDHFHRWVSEQKQEDRAHCIYYCYMRCACVKEK